MHEDIVRFNIHDDYGTIVLVHRERKFDVFPEVAAMLKPHAGKTIKVTSRWLHVPGDKQDVVQLLQWFGEGYGGRTKDGITLDIFEDAAHMPYRFCKKHFTRLFGEDVHTLFWWI